MNLTILGAPGSGKGFYGGPLANAWNVPLLTASNILRGATSTQDLDLDSGKLVDCQVVCEIIRDYLKTKTSQSSAFILDGFPRTRQQIEIMENDKDWPFNRRVHAAIKLVIPESVCLAKIMGRRVCNICGKSYNTAAVYQDGFELPPQLPDNCQRCDPEMDWSQRLDDSNVDIVRERLSIYREHEKPIVDYFHSKGRLIRLTPYFGEKDLPGIQQGVEDFITGIKYRPPRQSPPISP
jgi:adenylate kinase